MKSGKATNSLKIISSGGRFILTRPLSDADKLRSKSDLFFLSKLYAKMDRAQTPPTQIVKEQPLASQVQGHRSVI